jgi:hypothetical protein
VFLACNLTRNNFLHDDLMLLDIHDANKEDCKASGKVFSYFCEDFCIMGHVSGIKYG